MGGQYLDLVEARRGAPDEDAVRRVLTYKSGNTIERPLHLGHALAAAGAPGLTAAYSAYGLPLGEAFQLRATISSWGAPGAPEVTGQAGLGDDPARGQGDLPGHAGPASVPAGPGGSRLRAPSATPSCPRTTSPSCAG